MKFSNIFSKIKNVRQSEDLCIREVDELRKNSTNFNLVDVRSPQEYNENHLKGAINIPLYEINNKCKFPIQDKNATIVLYCASGTRSKKAFRILKKCGYKNLYNLKNGINSLEN